MADGVWVLLAGVLARVCPQFSAVGHFRVQEPPPPNTPIIVKVITPPHDPTGISDVIIGAIGLTGAIVLLAIVLGLLMAGVMFWVRRRNLLSR